MGELGHFALIWVAVSSTIGSGLYAWCKWHKSRSNFSLFLLTRLNGVAASLSLIFLAYLFVSDQFQFEYVASHSNSQLPIFFKVAAVWGGHQGSMLFWVFTLAIWSSCISLSKIRSKKYLNDVLWIMMLFVAVFAWFTLLASNPFCYSEVWLTQGRDLNPMLQDIGLIFHPPLLYLGYIGFSTVLAFALGQLMQTKYTVDWVKWATPWAVLSWAFLTLGIVLGSWWAYNELGWGGWWFWDPVENASLLPWLTATALLHSLLAARRYQQQQKVVFVLSLMTFSLSILGTFIVRSGVLTSVHAFAVDPTKGITLLVILMATLIGSFILFFERSDAIKSQSIKVIFSRGYLALSAVGVLTIICFTVFLGTFYPMVYELLGMGNISVGAPYFNTLLLPFVIISLSAMGFVTLMKWHQGSYFSYAKVIVLFLISLSVGFLLYRLQQTGFSFIASLIWGLGCWVIVTHLLFILKQKKITFMVCAHIGLAISTIGAVMNAEHSFEASYKISAANPVSFGDWQVEYQNIHWIVGPNYTAEQLELSFKSESKHFNLNPERRYYPVRVMNMSDPSIHSVWHGDYYVTLGSKIDPHSYAIKIQYKAYIFWIWCGVLIAAFGALIPVFKNLFRYFKSDNKGAFDGVVKQV